MHLRTLGSLVWRTIRRFDEENAMRHGAALAFYATLSLAPLLLLAVSALSLLPQAEVEQVVVEQLPLFVGERGTQIARDIIGGAEERTGGLLGMAGSLVLLLFGATALFVNVKGTLNEIWGVEPPDRGIVTGFLRTRATAVLMMMTTGLVFLVSTILGAAANWILPLLQTHLPVGSGVVSAVELGLSGVVLTLLCAATYRILPDVDIAWRDIWLGAVLTAVLFLIGRSLIGWYLRSAAATSRFGAAGSLFVFLMWVYYSAQIFFLGAEFTQVQAEHRGAPLRSRVQEEEPAGEG
jgi:membrane protein